MSAKSLNKVMLIGNVTRDPELRYTPQGNAVATFGLATNRSWKTEGGEIREEAEFHRLVAWNKLAELCSQLITKGRKIYVEGRLQTRTFTGSDNAQHTITEIVIDDMILLDSKFSTQGGSSVGGAPGTYQVGQTGAVPSAASEPVAETVAEPSVGTDAPSSQAKKTKKGKKDSGVKDEKEEKVEEATVVAPKADSGEVKEDVNLDDIPF